MAETSESTALTCWLLDTRTIWPGKKISDSESVRLLNVIFKSLLTSI